MESTKMEWVACVHNKISSSSNSFCFLLSKFLLNNFLNFISFSVWLFLRVFIIMGISWLLEIIAYMIDDKSDYAIILKITNIYNGFLGLICIIGSEEESAATHKER